MAAIMPHGAEALPGLAVLPHYNALWNEYGADGFAGRSYRHGQPLARIAAVCWYSSREDSTPPAGRW